MQIFQALMLDHLLNYFAALSVIIGRKPSNRLNMQPFRVPDRVQYQSKKNAVITLFSMTRKPKHVYSGLHRDSVQKLCMEFVMTYLHVQTSERIALCPNDVTNFWSLQCDSDVDQSKSFVWECHVRQQISVAFEHFFFYVKRNKIQLDFDNIYLENNQHVQRQR